MDLVKVNFHGKELSVIEKDGKRYVAMKPIVEALGLAWVDQFKLIKNDVVLGEAICVTPIPSSGGVQETVCLPLEYLNGWLFKVSAARYTGKKREAIIMYQKECYQALHQHFHQPKESISLDAILKLAHENARLYQENQILSLFKPNGQPGDISPITGREKWKIRRGQFTSAERARSINLYLLQPMLPGIDYLVSE